MSAATDTRFDVVLGARRGQRPTELSIAAEQRRRTRQRLARQCPHCERSPLQFTLGSGRLRGACAECGHHIELFPDATRPGQERFAIEHAYKRREREHTDGRHDKVRAGFCLVDLLTGAAWRFDRRREAVAHMRRALAHEQSIRWERVCSWKLAYRSAGLGIGHYLAVGYDLRGETEKLCTVAHHHGKEPAASRARMTAWLTAMGHPGIAQRPA